MQSFDSSSSSTLNAEMLIDGKAEGPVLFADTALSFWGGVDPETGIVIDQAHPLHGRSIAGAILAIPGGRGSCTGSAVLMQLIANGKAPAGLVFCQREEILTLGVIVAEEMYGLSIPVSVVEPERFAALADTERVRLVKEEDASPVETLHLTDHDRHLLSPEVPKATQVAMRIVIRMAGLLNAERLIDIRQVHVDGCIYTGPVSLDFAEKLAAWGGRVAVPTSLNAISVDQQRWREQGTDPTLSKAASALGDAYVRMGATPTFTCAPYQLESRPAEGEDIAWAESNAVVYANSVLGARTMKYPDFLDICIALTGRAPLAGCHLDENRKAGLVIDVHCPDGIDDSFWPLLGYRIGTLAPNIVPAIAGLEATTPTADDLKAFGAAFATTSAAPMFHIVGVTPEAPTLGEAASRPDLPHLSVTASDLSAVWNGFNPTLGDTVDLVALGNPHFSFEECKALAALCRGRVKHPDVALTLTVSRSTYDRIVEAGIYAELEAFGATFVRDACWCTVMQPIVPPAARLILTNSGKYAHYGPGLSGKQVRFAALSACVEAAVSGRSPAAPPRWLAH
ncbi:aconitase family protein [Ciceribacter sp. L1K22]|uniref:cis-3-hydroxy-L-proline dehydratase n=1 Tax=Ciceribacter sp. L1K22 TaxID=2820275 RepID=UPI001ABDFF17|nr:aconitase family protein [Ciceribacter sp. L1K22]MBO3759960.1 aconitase family protein [Ciceribacter sp. L1K22]